MKLKAFFSLLFVILFYCLYIYSHDANRYIVKGIDVSHYQGEINWTKVGEQDLDFVFIKATEGVSYNDSTFVYNWAESKKTKLKRGAYHFFKPQMSVEWQIKNFTTFVQLETGDFPPVLDVEDLKGVTIPQLIAKMDKWLTFVELHYQIKPMIYTYADLYERHLQAAFPEHLFWIAKYSRTAPKLNNKAPFWQYSNTGTIKGIEGAVDLNVFVGNKQGLDNFLL